MGPLLPEFPNQRQPAPHFYFGCPAGKILKSLVSLPFLLNPSLSRVNSVLPLWDSPLRGDLIHPQTGELNLED